MSSLSQKSLGKLKVFRTLLAEEVTMPFRIKKKPIAIMIIVWEKALKNFGSVKTILKISNIINLKKQRCRFIISHFFYKLYLATRTFSISSGSSSKN